MPKISRYQNAKPLHTPIYKIGDTIFDLPSNQTATIVAITQLFHDRNDLCYELDNSVPLDPTGDGAFPTRRRLDCEICLPWIGPHLAKSWSY